MIELTILDYLVLVGLIFAVGFVVGHEVAKQRSKTRSHDNER